MGRQAGHRRGVRMVGGKGRGVQRWPPVSSLAPSGGPFPGGLHAHLCPEGSSLLGETGRREVADHICHGPVHRAAAGRLTLDTPGDGGGGAVTGRRTEKNSVSFLP